MLEVRNLTKVYKPKRGVPVTAVDHVNLKFPETGMIFLLGKSGSGKSTMLNLLGGLDVYDEGEIIIKDKSSKDFKQRDFDSYRNTYLGFIFQEYNILNDFNVGANIALALQLQGQKATDDQINEILEKVDLAGFGIRKPNELSGGQKQRVAIARALVKDPEIIMADEPTGALDSETGRQVLDTLKKLSKDKLVIVVSHDREFAEKYADRIIELADGRVISDMEYLDMENTDDAPAILEEQLISEKQLTPEEQLAQEGLIFAENSVSVAPAYHLTEEDRIAINEWIDAHQSGITISVRGGAEGKKNTAFRKGTPTDESKITSLNVNPFHLIKSKLPMKHAFKMGASGLKHKKFRLVITIILSCIAYTLFGVADTMANYDYVSAGAKSIRDSKITYASFQKEERMGAGILSYYVPQKMDQESVDKIKKDTGLEVTGVVSLDEWGSSFSNQYNSDSLLGLVGVMNADSFSGMVTMDEEMAKKAGLKLLAGRFADGSKPEVVISEYVAYTFMMYGYRAPDATEDNYEKISSEADMIGKIIKIGGIDMEVVGILDTNFDFERYSLKLSVDPADVVLSFVLRQELESYQDYSFICMAMVGDGFIENILLNSDNSLFINSFGTLGYFYSCKGGDDYYESEIVADAIMKLSEKNRSKIVWLGEEKTKLASNEVVVDEGSLRRIIVDYFGMEDSEYLLTEDILKKAAEIELTKNSTTWGDSENNQSTVEENSHIVGYIPIAYAEADDFAYVVDDATFDFFNDARTGTYEFALGVMPESYSDIYDLVAYSHNGKKIQYSLENSAMYELDILDELFKFLGRFFMGLGIFFAIFASILMATFISSSISYKRKEIGILRAIGARGSDVFRIFFSESFIIAMINFVLSSIGTMSIAMLVNSMLRSRAGILVTVLQFGIRQVALLFVISVGVAAIASFLPVFINAKKKPIDVIRDK